jgi:hypothetical protein
MMAEYLQQEHSIQQQHNIQPASQRVGVCASRQRQQQAQQLQHHRVA